MFDLKAPPPPKLTLKLLKFLPIHQLHFNTPAEIFKLWPRGFGKNAKNSNCLLNHSTETHRVRQDGTETPLHNESGYTRAQADSSWTTRTDPFGPSQISGYSG